MKRLFLLLTAVSIGLVTLAQADNLPPYKKIPYFPPVKLLLTDSSTVYQRDDLPKKTPVMLMYFHPKCEHCQRINLTTTAKRTECRS